MAVSRLPSASQAGAAEEKRFDEPPSLSGLAPTARAVSFDGVLADGGRFIPIVDDLGAATENGLVWVSRQAPEETWFLHASSSQGPDGAALPKPAFRRAGPIPRQDSRRHRGGGEEAAHGFSAGRRAQVKVPPALASFPVVGLAAMAVLLSLFIIIAACGKPYLTCLDYSRAVEIPFETSARGGIVISTADGTVIACKTPHKRSSMGSTAKLMTSWLWHDFGDDETTVFLNPYEVEICGENTYWPIDTDHHGPAGSMVQHMMQVSDNCEAHALSRYAAIAAGRTTYGDAVWVQLTAAAEMMNERAVECGMTETSFVSPSGLYGPSDGIYLPDGLGRARLNYSTANDMTLLAINAMAGEAVAMRGRFGPGVEYIKTGTNSGRSLLSRVEIDGTMYYITVLDCPREESGMRADVAETIMLAEWLEGVV